MNGDKPVYNVQQRAKAGTSATLRAAVALYILYLGWSILRNTVSGESTIPVWVGWLAGLVFIAAALGFCVYAVKRYRIDLAAAEVHPEELPEDNAEE